MKGSVKKVLKGLDEILMIAGQSTTSMSKRNRKLAELKLASNFTSKLPADALTPLGPSPRTALPALPGKNEGVSSEKESLNESTTPETMVKTCRLVKSSLFTYLLPEKVERPQLLCVSDSALKLLELDPELEKSQEFEQILAGNAQLSEFKPFCHFGLYAGQLGDGRCISIAEVVTSGNSIYELQLKGCGQTPFSRYGDGYYTLSSCIREFLASEYMAALGVPTTRGLLKQLAEYCIEQIFNSIASDPPRETDIPFVEIEGAKSRKIRVRLNKFARLFKEIIRNTAEMIAHWQAIGFCHGTMNTDNMSIIGNTMDYGAFGFMDAYDPDYCSNLSDQRGRYSFSNQPRVALWNLSKLGRTFTELVTLPLENGSSPFDTTETDVISGADVIATILRDYQILFEEKYLKLMRSKLGLTTDREDDFDALINPLLQILADSRADYTDFFRALCAKETDTNACLDIILAALDMQYRQEDGIFEQMVQENQSSRTGSLERVEKQVKPMFRQFINTDMEIVSEDDISERWTKWITAYRSRLFQEAVKDDVRVYQMKRVNPKFSLRNCKVTILINSACVGILFEVTSIVNKEMMYGSAENASDILHRGLQVIIKDCYGGSFDKKDALYKHEIDKTFAERCAGEPPADMVDISIYNQG